MPFQSVSLFQDSKILKKGSHLRHFQVKNPFILSSRTIPSNTSSSGVLPSLPLSTAPEMR